MMSTIVREWSTNSRCAAPGSAITLAFMVAESTKSVHSRSGDTRKRDILASVERLPAELRDSLARCGFSAARLAEWAASIEGDASQRRRVRNVVDCDMRAPTFEELPELAGFSQEHAHDLERLGRDAIARGELGLIVMAGGMATRMGGQVKALVEFAPGETFLEARLAACRHAKQRFGVEVPLYLMTSAATNDAIRAALQNTALKGATAETFVQNLSLRLTTEGQLFLRTSRDPSPYATGHGDLPEAFVRSGALERFRKRGGKVLWITNLDNLGATIDPVVLGYFLEQNQKNATRVLVEVCQKKPCDRGGIPVHAQGRLQVLEEFRLPSSFNPEMVRVFNTNTFVIDATVLEQCPAEWSYFEVEKKVDGHAVLQFERLLQELTAWFPSSYLCVPRDGIASRFLPVKDQNDLERSREQLNEIANHRWRDLQSKHI
jgi:UTP--glucose-1-phosphate uridylyltransferase